MAIVHVYNRARGVTYVYESQSYWDKEKHMSRAKRTLIGRLDPDTGEIIPTDGRNRKAKPASPDKGTDYKDLYEKLLKKYASQEKLIDSLKKEIAALKERG